MRSIRNLIQTCADNATYEFLGGRQLNEIVIKITKNADILCYISRGEMLGFISFYCNRPEKDFSFINMLCVDPIARRRGIANCLISSAMNQAQSQKFGAMRLEVHDANHSARALYHNLGFKELSRASSSSMFLQREIAPLNKQAVKEDSSTEAGGGL